MIKAKLFDINGKEKGTVELPRCFSAKDREDLVAKVLDAKKRKQPYAPSPIAGNQASASGVINHRRHV
jgi:ribosomal protein L4